jgi:NAD(P)-dependent dehydrogenase (short-subunit alcohol dehydrogenase family)
MLRAENDNVTAKVLDVTNKDSIAALVKEFREEDIKLDVLVNNAAVLLDGDVDLMDISPEDFLTTLNTNTVAPFLVTRSFMSFLKQGSRVVMMSSGAGAYCDSVSDWAPIYSLSKTGLNAVTRQLAKVLEPKGILINAACPGWVKTDMGGEGATRSIKEGAETPVWLATEVNESGKFWRDKQVIDW